MYFFFTCSDVSMTFDLRHDDVTLADLLKSASVKPAVIFYLVIIDYLYRYLKGIITISISLIYLYRSYIQ